MTIFARLFQTIETNAHKVVVSAKVVIIPVAQK